MVRRKSARRQRVEEDPMAGTSNLVDAMLVMAVGFLVFVIISWNMTAMVSEDATPQQPSRLQKLKKTLSWMKCRIPATHQGQVIQRRVMILQGKINYG